MMSVNDITCKIFHLLQDQSDIAICSRPKLTQAGQWQHGQCYNSFRELTPRL